MRRVVLTYGLIAGAILAAMMVLTMPIHDRIGFDRMAIVGYTSMVLAFLMVFFGVQSYRDSVAGGRVTFGRALLVGLAITAIATVCYVVSWQIVSRTMVPDFLERYTAYTVEQAKRSGASEAQVAEQERALAEFSEMYKNPLVNIALTALEPLPVGLVFSLVTAGVLSRKRPDAASASHGAPKR